MRLGSRKTNASRICFLLSVLDLSALADINPVREVFWMRLDESVEGVHPSSYAGIEYVFGHDLARVPEAFVAQHAFHS